MFGGVAADSAKYPKGSLIQVKGLVCLCGDNAS